nr:conserved hypothetical protein [Melanopsichium pennsylvanicum 4]
MAYIEEEMKKRTGRSALPSDLDGTAMRRALDDPEDSLYAMAERYKELQRSIKSEQTQEEREGNVALSAAMLSSIPEVDLGIHSRMKNIEETERAKREFYKKRKKEGAVDAPTADEAYANARFQRARPRANNLDFQHRPAEGSHGAAGGDRGARKQMATDQLAVDRFRKRQRKFR